MGTYKTMKDIGAELGLTSHQVGRLLKKAGLRTSSGKPSNRAYDEKWVAQKFSDYNYLWAWDSERVIPLLKSMI